MKSPKAGVVPRLKMVSGKRKKNGKRVRKRLKKRGFGEPFAERNPAVI